MNTITLDAVLETIADEVGFDCQLLTVRTLLLIINKPNCTQKDVEIHLKISNAAASRNVSYWTDLKFDRNPGAGFVTRIEDPDDRRFKILSLTKKGRDFAERLRNIDQRRKTEEHGETAR